jgi:tRNA-splicing ligase RtcB
MKHQFATDTIPIYSWAPAETIEESAMKQVLNLTKLPFAVHHIALMPDVHTGYGMPIGGVLATAGAVIPNAVGVDEGCGMGAVRTNVPKDAITKEHMHELFGLLKSFVPAGEGKAHKEWQHWDRAHEFRATCEGTDRVPPWLNDRVWDLAMRNLGTLGGGNHFLDVLYDEEDYLWLMVHSGSRNLGFAICKWYNDVARDFNQLWYSNIPDLDLAFLPVEHADGMDFVRDMNFALEYAHENRRIMMNHFKMCFSRSVSDRVSNVDYTEEINIHHNYAALENHYGKNLWVHRKGATSARAGQLGIIPGSMGTPSYIVKGMGRMESFHSCSHGAGRPRSRTDTTKTFTVKQANESIKHLWYFSGWPRISRGKLKGRKDISESPLAYKNIDDVIESQSDLVQVVYKLQPLAVMIGK